MRLVRGGDDDVLSGAQTEALGHLAQVDVGLAASFGGAVEEEVLLHVLLVAMHLDKGAKVQILRRVMKMKPPPVNVVAVPHLLWNLQRHRDTASAV